METLKVDQELKHYTIRGVLGSGGFAVTYLAEDQMLGKLFAIKEYFPESLVYREGTTVLARTASGEDFDWGRKRFLEEARTLAKFDHPNIVGVTQIFEANNTAYMVLEYQKGRSFKAWLEKIGKPTQDELDLLLDPLLDALSFIHERGILHRDIAPDNIYIRDGGSPVLLDFGSAREALGQRSKSVSAIVKSGYSPYEQYTTTRRNQGPWTDIYALAATLYYAVTGIPPPEAAERVLEDSYVPAVRAAKGAWRPEFLSATDWGLAVTPQERPQTIDEWRTSLLNVKGVKEDNSQIGEPFVAAADDFKHHRSRALASLRFGTDWDSVEPGPVRKLAQLIVDHWRLACVATACVSLIITWIAVQETPPPRGASDPSATLTRQGKISSSKSSYSAEDPAKVSSSIQTLGVETLCRQALARDKTRWDTYGWWQDAVAEATRRKLSVDDCRLAVGLPKHQAPTNDEPQVTTNPLPKAIPPPVEWLQ